MNELTKAAHALDGIPVTAIYNDGREEETTVAKAIGVGYLAKEARNEWAEVGKKLDYAFAEAGWFEKTDPLARQQASEALAKADPIGRFNRMYEAYQTEQKYKQAQKRLVGLIKAELINRKTAAMKKKRVKLERQTAAMKSANDVAMAEVAKAEQWAQDQLAKHNAFIADANQRIDAMRARLSDGWEQAEIQEARRVAVQTALEDRDRQEWLFKASVVTDPILRGVYMARAEGREMSDDEV